MIHILPMRNWNMSTRPSRTLPMPFTSYLWGIETHFYHLTNMGMYIIHILPMRNWNSLGNLMRKIAQVNSHPTYEELKLVSPVSAVINLHFIHILPMRNWNLLKSRHRRSCSLFTSYLWGIETYLSSRQTKALYLIHILPMRNWNSHIHL